MSTSFYHGNQSLDAMPIGAVLDSPLDLEAITSGRWIRLDGRDVARNSYPEIAPYYPVGTFTSTARTLYAQPNYFQGVADNNNFVVLGAAGVNPIQASTDGNAWYTSSSWTSGTAPICLILAGSRFIMAGSGGDLTVPYVSTANTYTATTQGDKANWSATTVAGTTDNHTMLAYSPSLGLTAYISGTAAGTTIYTLADGSTTWVARTTPTSAAKWSIVWTGQKFIAFCRGQTGPTFQTSTNGTTWVDGYAPWYYPAISMCVSDGNGTVVALDENGYSPMGGMVLVSKDHGSTWRAVMLPKHYQESYGTGTRTYELIDYRSVPSYCNGRFFITPYSGTGASGRILVSADGVNWQVDPIPLRGAQARALGGRVIYKAGVYLGFAAGSTIAFTFTENAGSFRLPLGLRGTNNTNYQESVPYFSLFMKVRSS